MVRVTIVTHLLMCLTKDVINVGLVLNLNIWHLFLKEVLEKAREIYDEVDIDRKPRIGSASLFLRDTLPHDKRNLKWFLTPHDAATIIADTEGHYQERKKYR